MATLRFRGDAQARAQVTWVTVQNVEVGDTFTLTINGKDIAVEATDYRVSVEGIPTPISDPAHSVYQLWEEEIADTDIAEFGDIASATAEIYDSSGAPSTVLAGNYVALKLVGQDDGKPFTVTGSASDNSGLTVTVATVVDGSAGKNEKQRISFQTTPTGGTYTLTFNGQTTTAINYNETAANIQTALVALSNIASGDVTVTGSYSTSFVVEFKQAYANTEVPLISGDGSSLTGAGSVQVITTTGGSATTNFQQRITGTREESASYWAGYARFNKPTGPSAVYQLAESLTASQVQDAYLTPFYGSANTICTKAYDSEGVAYFIVEFTGIYAGDDLASIEAITTSDGTLTITTEQEPSTSGTDEVQVIRLLGGPTGGTFTLTYSGQTTAAIAYNAAASAVQSALEALSNIGVGDVAVTGNAGGPWTVTFGTLLGDQDVPQMSGSGASLTGGTLYTTRIQSAEAPRNEVQSVTIDGVATGGTFTLTYSGQTTGTIAYNASASDIVTALEALSNIGAGDVNVSGEDGGPWTVTFQNALANTNVAAMTASGASLTGGGGTEGTTVTTTINATSKHHWDNAENWDGGTVPTTNDTVIIENSDVDIRYGIDQNAVTLTALHIKSTYTGRIGLPDVNELGEGEYFEYRERYLKIGATSCVIGAGEGDGAELIRLNFGSVQTNCVIQKTGNSVNADPVVLIRGTHASNVLNISKGSCALAWYASETATFATMNIGHQGGQDDDVTLFIGSGVTFTTVNMSGGRVVAEAGGSGVWTQTGGETTMNGTNGQSGQLILQADAIFHYNNTGTLGSTPVVAGNAVLDFEQDWRAKTVTNPIEVQSETAQVLDDNQVVSNLRLDLNYTHASVNSCRLGTNVRVTRGTPS